MKSVFILLALAASIGVQAQQIITDRPDQTEASSTIPEESIQMEMGFQYTSSSTPSMGTDEWASPNLLLRYGLTKGIELRAITEFGSRPLTENILTPEAKGLRDIALGAKIQLLRDPEKKTEIALLSHVSIPSGNRFLTEDEYVYDARFSISHPLGEDSSIGYNLGGSVDEDGSATGIYTLAVGKPVGEKGGVYAEPFGEYDFDSEELEASFDAGFTYLLRDNMQIDISFGTGLNHRMVYLSSGFSWNISAK